MITVQYHVIRYNYDVAFVYDVLLFHVMQIGQYDMYLLEQQSDNQNSEELTTLTKKEIEDELEDIDPTSVSFFRVTPSAE